MRLTVVAGSAVALLLLAGRIAWTGSTLFSFLAWNLALAWLPLLTSTALSRWAPRGKAGAPVLVAAAVVWLLLFPNAPYVVTDFMHLHQHAKVPLWFDLAMLFAFAWAAGACGLVSLRQMHGLVRARAGELAGVAFVGATALLTGFGIYLGRFDRWNSWDVVTRPRALFGGVVEILVDPVHHARAYGVTAVFAALLLVAYAAAAPPAPRSKG